MTAIHFLWRNRTKALGFAQVTVGVLAASTDLFSADVVKLFLLFNGLLTAWVGFFNSSKE